MASGSRAASLSAAAASAARRGTKFGLLDGDAEDFYDVVMSSEDEDDASDAGDDDREAETARNTALNGSQPHDEAERLAALSLHDAKATTMPSAVMTHIGSISYGAASDRAAVPKPTTTPSGDDEFVLTEEELHSHSQRRSALEIALDAATRSLPPVTDAGEAPFRFASMRGKPVTSPAPGSSGPPSAGNAPQQSESAKRKPGMPLGVVHELDSDDEELTTEPDPLYDDAMDDADEKWVQTNLRGNDASGSKTDATLCCPCCFVTVCMDCQRHVKYINQYRARAAMNCRINKDEILTYATSGASDGPSRQQLHAMTARHATNGAAALLGKDEYFGVVCSDCGTTVGVYDAIKDYHFFNILPSNC